MNPSIKRLCARRLCSCLFVCVVLLAGRENASSQARPNAPDGTQTLGSIQGKSLSVSINSDGSYAIARSDLPGAVLRSKVEADVNDGVLQSSAYPRRKIAQSEFHDEFGSGSKLIVTHTGLAGKPDLVCTIRLYKEQSWGDIAVEVHQHDGQSCDSAGDSQRSDIGLAEH